MWSMQMAGYNITFVYVKGKNQCFGRLYLQVKSIKYLQRTIGELNNISG